MVEGQQVLTEHLQSRPHAQCGGRHSDDKDKALAQSKPLPHRGSKHLLTDRPQQRVPVVFFESRGGSKGSERGIWMDCCRRKDLSRTLKTG